MVLILFVSNFVIFDIFLGKNNIFCILFCEIIGKNLKEIYGEKSYKLNTDLLYYNFLRYNLKIFFFIEIIVFF